MKKEKIVAVILAGGKGTRLAPYTLNYNRFIQYHRQKRGVVTIAMNERKVPLDLSVMECDRNGRLTGYLEKPIPSYSVSMGIYMFEKRVLRWIPTGKYLDFPGLIQKLLRRRERVTCYPSNDFWLDIGRHEDCEEAHVKFQEKRKGILYER